MRMNFIKIIKIFILSDQLEPGRDEDLILKLEQKRYYQISHEGY